MSGIGFHFFRKTENMMMVIFFYRFDKSNQQIKQINYLLHHVSIAFNKMSFHKWTKTNNWNLSSTPEPPLEGKLLSEALDLVIQS